MKFISKLLLTLTSCCALLNSSFAQQEDAKLIGLRSSTSGRVVFSGIANNDVTAGSGGLLYGPGLIGAAATLLFQGIFTSAAQSAQKTSLQAEADKVLLPYAEPLEKFEYPELIEQSVKGLMTSIRFSKDGSRIDSEWMIDIIPSFKMTQDQSALMVETVVGFYAPKNNIAEKPDHKVIVRVWSKPELGTDTASLWAENNAERIKYSATKLTQESINIAINDWSQKEQKDMSEHTSVRLMQGKIQTIERAQIIDKKCDRVLMRTLRNILVSAPTPESNSDICFKPAVSKTIDDLQPRTLATLTKAID